MNTDVTNGEGITHSDDKSFNVEQGLIVTNQIIILEWRIGKVLTNQFGYMQGWCMVDAPPVESSE